MKRAILVVLDSLGVGAMPDAASYGDEGANTLGHIVESCGDLAIPNLRKMGFLNIEGVSVGARATAVEGAFARLAERSQGKDTITGHWEIAGLLTEVPFKTFPQFPESFMKAYEAAIGIGTLGNYAASGTEIIKDLGEEHKRTKKPIIYTSADSVFQIAVNVDLTPLSELYRYCEIAREMLVGDVQVGRVIARPFIERDGEYIRTSDRKDYAVSPSGPTVLDKVKATGQEVVAIGKIADIFNGQGITREIHTESNMDGVDQTIAVLKEEFSGFVFTNLVDFDSKFGHRRDPQGYGRAIEEFDARLPELTAAMKAGDVLMLCADHGNDPVHAGWDHTREYVPFTAWGQPVKAGVDLGTRSSFADIGATIADYLDAAPTIIGASFREEIVK